MKTKLLIFFASITFISQAQTLSKTNFISDGYPITAGFPAKIDKKFTRVKFHAISKFYYIFPEILRLMTEEHFKDVLFISLFQDFFLNNHNISQAFQPLAIVLLLHNISTKLSFLQNF